jgi:predicted nucleic acid-binding protein
MIVLDTCVLSEPLKPAPSQAVVDWLDNQVAESLTTTTINLAELLSGAARLPEGRRKQRLAHDIEQTIQGLFGQRILPFDVDAALAYGQIESLTRKSGQPLSVADQQIAAIAKSRNYTVATRDVTPFLAAGLTVINPWGSSLP